MVTTPSSSTQINPILIKDRPQALFLPQLKSEGINRYGKRCSELFAHVTQKIKDSGNLSEEDIEELQFFPEAYRALAFWPQGRKFVFRDLFSVPNVAFDIITADYKNAEPVESYLYSYAETVYRLLRWSDEQDVDLRYSRQFYKSLLLEDITWAVRWYKYSEEEDYAFQILDHIEKTREHLGGSACLYLKLNPTEPLEAYQSVLQNQWKYSYIASCMFAPRGLDVGLVAFNAIESPQWAYHFLRTFPTQVDRERAEAALVRDPLWLTEYLLENPEVDRANLYERCLEECPEHPLIKDLHEWMELVDEKGLLPPLKTEYAGNENE